MEHETNRLSRLVTLLTILQSKRLLSGTELARRFSVSTRTIYRDIRTLEQAGVPVVTVEGKGYTLVEGYRLPPILFTREEAMALLTAEKLATGLTDTSTAQFTSSAMDKLRAALRRTDRDQLEILSPHIQVLGHGDQPNHPNVYQQLVTAMTLQRVVQISYWAANANEVTIRDVEPIGLYLSQQWHVIGFCRLRQAFRNFRLDRITQLSISGEVFTARSETLQQYWVDEAARRGKEKVVVRLQPASVWTEQAQRLHDTKHQYGWAYEKALPTGELEMTFFIGSFPYLAAWLLPYAGAITILEPPELQQQLSNLAQRAYTFFVLPNRV
ncbi:helix-turn-helix transcriptional regulator [uncultured Fibrella sp.]|uniref:helix-turn-helix transcriptional regulator n=1 Tax=uncultured Fibrella sp. TaxID=1284596 RepID=UPI0035CB7C2D